MPKNLSCQYLQKTKHHARIADTATVSRKSVHSLRTKLSEHASKWDKAKKENYGAKKRRNRPKTIKEIVRDEIRKEANKNVETKYFDTYADHQLSSNNGYQFQPIHMISQEVDPQDLERDVIAMNAVPLGTGNNQRIGKSIKNKKLHLSIKLKNQTQSQVNIRLALLGYNKNATNQIPIDFDPNGPFQVTPQEDLAGTTFPVLAFRDVKQIKDWRVLRDIRYCLGQSWLAKNNMLDPPDLSADTQAPFSLELHPNSDSNNINDNTPYPKNSDTASVNSLVDEWLVPLNTTSIFDPVENTLERPWISAENIKTNAYFLMAAVTSQLELNDDDIRTKIRLTVNARLSYTDE